jgi:hypothetical protein
MHSVLIHCQCGALERCTFGAGVAAAVHKRPQSVAVLALPAVPENGCALRMRRSARIGTSRYAP